MFTGLVDHCGIICGIQTISNGLKIQIKHHFTAIEIGESIAVDGMCLTVTQFTQDIFHCDISIETLALTTAKNFQTGQGVNLERALLPTSRIGGHFVTGHVDQIGQIASIQDMNDFREIKINILNKKARLFLIKKGSIAVNGVSLTINEVEEDSFKILLIPHTLERTHLKNIKVQDWVNLEFDMLSKIIVQTTENLMS
jgi:riboflavin synthase